MNVMARATALAAAHTGAAAIGDETASAAAIRGALSPDTTLTTLSTTHATAATTIGVGVGNPAGGALLSKRVSWLSMKSLLQDPLADELAEFRSRVVGGAAIVPRSDSRTNSQLDILNDAYDIE